MCFNYFFSSEEDFIKGTTILYVYTLVLVNTES